MPFPTVMGLPVNTSAALRKQIRAEIIRVLSKETGIPANIIHPFAPADMFGDADPGQDSTIYISLDSSMFVGPEKGTADFREKATKSIAQVVFDALGGEYEVECFIGDLNPLGKTILKPNPHVPTKPYGGG